MTNVHIKRIIKILFKKRILNILKLNNNIHTLVITIIASVIAPEIERVERETAEAEEANAEVDKDTANNYKTILESAIKQVHLRGY